MLVKCFNLEIRARLILWDRGSIGETSVCISKEEPMGFILYTWRRHVAMIKINKNTYLHDLHVLNVKENIALSP